MVVHSVLRGFFHSIEWVSNSKRGVEGLMFAMWRMECTEEAK